MSKKEIIKSFQGDLDKVNSELLSSCDSQFLTRKKELLVNLLLSLRQSNPADTIRLINNYQRNINEFKKIPKSNGHVSFTERLKKYV